MRIKNSLVCKNENPRFFGDFFYPRRDNDNDDPPRNGKAPLFQAGLCVVSGDLSDDAGGGFAQQR